MHATTKQLITLLLMTATLVMALTILPEGPIGSAPQNSTKLANSTSK